jgi:hypothetical protein
MIPLHKRAKKMRTIGNIATTRAAADVTGNDLGLEASDFAQFRAHYLSFAGKETTLSDDDIIDMVSDTTDDMEPEAWAALMVQTEAKLAETPVVTDPEAVRLAGQSVLAHAIAAAGKVGKVLASAFATVADAKEELDGGPLKVMLALRSTYNEEELSSWPEPDTDTGNNPDKFKVPVIVDGKTVMRNSSFYIQFFKATEMGKALDSELEYLSILSSDTADKSTVPADYAKTYSNPQSRRLRKTYVTRRQGAARNALKKAVKFMFQFDRVNGLLGVTATLMMEGETVMNTAKPILLENVANPKLDWEFYSLGGFMRLDADRASQMGGTYAALIGTAGRAPKSGTGATETKVETIKTVPTLVNAIVELHRFTDEIFSATNPKDVGELYKLVNHKDADELVLSIVELRDSLTQVINSQKLKGRYDKITSAGPL